MKSLLEIHSPSGRHWVGDGFPVRTVFHPQDRHLDLSPFLLLDYAGPETFPPATHRRGVGFHPHRGFETVTLVYQGEVEHRDTAGHSGTIRPGGVQWMTAASGVLHEEMHSDTFTLQGGVFQAVQLWVNLPAKDKMTAPAYQELTAESIPEARLPGGGTLRVIAGEFSGTRGPARTHTPVHLFDLRLEAGHAVDLPLPDGFTTALCVLEGEVALMGGDTAGEADLAVFSRKGGALRLEARAPTLALVLCGAPLGEPVAHYGPFVMNTKEEIQQAILDFQGGRFGLLSPPKA